MITVSRSPAVVVLVVRDDHARAALGEALEVSGFLVAAYAHADQAQRLLEDLKPEFVVVANDDEQTGALVGACGCAQVIAAEPVDCSSALGAIRVRDLADVPDVVRSLHVRQQRTEPPAANDRSSRDSGPRAAAFAIVAEDDPVLASVLCGALADEGFSTKVASTCAEARELLAEHPAAVLILDLTLPDGFGGDILADAEIRGALPRTLIVSSFALAELVARRHDCELLPKPFELEAFLDAFERTQTRPRKARRSMSG
jgi:DNA-binding NtrC family response regulator